MRKFIFTLLTMMVSVSLMAQEESKANYLYIDNFEIAPGETMEIAVNMANDRKITLIDCSIVAPEGISFVEQEIYDEDEEEWTKEYGVLTSRKHSTHVLQSNLIEGNTLKVLVTSGTLKSFKQNDGAVFTLKVAADENIAAGTYELKIVNSLLTSEALEKITLEDVAAIVTVPETATGISNVAVGMADGVAYNLAGQKVGKAFKGIAVMDGKKIVVR